MGYEKGITRKISAMLLDGVYPESTPGGPRSPDSAKGGTPNHELLARVARLIWRSKNSNLRDYRAERDELIYFFDAQHESGFMTRGDANEQLSPSHSSWWITGVLAARLSAWRNRAHEDLQLLSATQDWLYSHHWLCSHFATPVGIVAPGARAWPDPPEGKTYYGRCQVRDMLYKLITGSPVKRTWAPSNLDMLGLVFMRELISAGDEVFKSVEALKPRVWREPKLCWPIEQWKGENGFISWMPRVSNTKGLRVQKIAEWSNGKENYGFDNDTLLIEKSVVKEIVIGA